MVHHAWWGGWWWIWWIVWILILVWVLGFLLPGSRRLQAGRAPTPLEVLQRRLAHGDITVDDYEQRLALLRRDQPRREQQRSEAPPPRHSGDDRA